MRFLPLAVALLFFLLSCSRESPEFVLTPKSHLGGEYQGGIFPVWITLKEPVENKDLISWKTGSSRIAYRRQGSNEKSLITADTAFLYWETPPPMKLDSIETTKSGDTTKTWRIDSVYVDTIFAIVDGLRSEPMIIKVQNILPNIKSLSVAGLEQPGDSTLMIAAHPGDRLEIAISLEKTFNKAYSPVIEGIEILGENLTSKQRSDSLYLWEWIVPNKDIDTTAVLRIKDSNGYGERIYNIRLVVYADFGSVWVASQKEVVKYSATGARVVKISDTFDLISDIAVHSNNGRLFVIDQDKNTFAVYNTYGKQLYKNNTLLKNPTSIALDIDGNYVWVADFERLRPFTFSGSDIVANDSLGYSLAGQGQVKGLSPDQFQREFLWFAVPERDTVGYIRYSVADSAADKTPEYQPNDKPDKWNRPSMVSLDPANGLAWIADSSRILAIDTAGNEFAIISGFGYVSSVSASGGSVWASDILRGCVYHFPGPFKGTNRDLSRTVMDGMIVDEFSAPAFISAFIADGSAWVMDKGTGKTVRVDSKGNITAEGIGLAPLIGKTVQMVE